MLLERQEGRLLLREKTRNLEFNVLDDEFLQRGPKWGTTGSNGYKRRDNTITMIKYAKH